MKGRNMEKTNFEIPGERKGELFVNCSGVTEANPTQHFGPAIRPYYQIHFILSGSGTFTTGGKEFTLGKGEGFLISPEEVFYYRASEETPWKFAWVGFSGNDAGRLIKGMNLSVQNPKFKLDQIDIIEQMFQDMSKCVTCGDRDELRRNGLLKVFLSMLAGNKVPSKKNDLERAGKYVGKAIEYIQNNYCRPIKITEAAEYVGVNRSYLYTLFMNTTGISPHQFMANYRINKAAELLQTTGMAIEGVALSCGYTDSLVFTKAFKQMKGMSPSVYRKTVQKAKV